MYDQLYEYIKSFFNQLMCRFRKTNSTQLTVFRYLQKLQKDLTQGGSLVQI